MSLRRNNLSGARGKRTRVGRYVLGEYTRQDNFKIDEYRPTLNTVRAQDLFKNFNTYESQREPRRRLGWLVFSETYRRAFIPLKAYNK